MDARWDAVMVNSNWNRIMDGRTTNQERSSPAYTGLAYELWIRMLISPTMELGGENVSVPRTSKRCQLAVFGNWVLAWDAQRRPSNPARYFVRHQLIGRMGLFARW